jgi:hypothetical protein
MNTIHSINKKRCIRDLDWNLGRDEKIQKKSLGGALTQELEFEKYSKKNEGKTENETVSLVENLPYELKKLCMSFLKDDAYLLIAPVSKMFRKLFLDTFSTTKTSCIAAISSVSCARYCIYQVYKSYNKSFWDSCETLDNDSHRIDWVTQIMRRAVSEGKNEILYLADEFELHLNDILDDEQQLELGKHVNIDILQFLRRKVFQFRGYVGLGAAKGGRLDILKWMKENGYPMEIDNNYWTLCYQAAKAGKLEALQWAIKEGFEFFQERMAGYHAAVGGHLDVLKWMKCNGFQIEIDKALGSLGYQAARNGHLHVLKWIKSEGISLNKRICAAAAASSGDIEVLAFCKNEGCVFEKDTLLNAVRTGNLDIVKYCFDLIECPRNDESLCTTAVNSGNLECLKLVRSYGVPWGKRTCNATVRYGNLPMLKYALENGCPWDPNIYDIACTFSVNSKGNELLRYLEEKNFQN